MILKLKRSFHLSDRSFGFGFPIGFEGPIIGTFIERRFVAAEGYLGKGRLEESYQVPQR